MAVVMRHNHRCVAKPSQRCAVRVTIGSILCPGSCKSPTQALAHARSPHHEEERRPPPEEDTRMAVNLGASQRCRFLSQLDSVSPRIAVGL